MSRNKETIEQNKSQNEEHKLPCGKCLGATRHKVLHSVDAKGEALDWGYHYLNQYQIVQCQGCETISFRKCHSNSEDFILEEDSGEMFYIQSVELYPSRVAGRHKLRNAFPLPHEIEIIYDETHSALCNKQPVLAGIGIRALVESVCKEKQAKGSDLEKKIDNLVTIGVLTQTGAEILHSMRILGNVAAHEVKPHSEQTLNIAMDVVEHLLNDVYILPAVTSKLPKRKKTGTP